MRPNDIEALDPSVAIPAPEELIARAEALIPYLREQADRHRQERRLLPEAIAKVREAGLFRVLQPRRWGGYEMSPAVFGEVQNRLARGDTSMGFAYGVMMVHSFHVGFYDDRAAREVWGEDPDALIASPYIPAGRAVKVEGGYRLSGRWPFSTGCDNCDWNFLSGTIEGEEGPLLTRMHAFLVPRADAAIVDSWHVMGLQGTGSKDIEVKDAFVPDYRVERFPITDPAACPGYAHNDGPLFHVPFLPLFFRAVSSAALGALEAMIEQFCAYTAGRYTVLSEQVARDPAVQIALAQARAGAEEMHATLRRDLESIYEAAQARTPLAPDRFTMLMLQSTNVPHRCEQLALGLMRAAGANGIRLDRALAPLFSDILVIGQHSSNNPKMPASNLGKMMLNVMD